MSGSARHHKRVEGPLIHGGGAPNTGVIHEAISWHPAVFGLLKRGINLQELSGAARSFPRAMGGAGMEN